MIPKIRRPLSPLMLISFPEAAGFLTVGEATGASGSIETGRKAIASTGQPATQAALVGAGVSVDRDMRSFPR